VKPVLGITPDFENETGTGPDKKAARYILWERYVSAVVEAGGAPMILPYVRMPEEVDLYLDRIDGLIVTGGAFDIDPAHYGETWGTAKGTVKETRTAFEMMITRGALERNFPILGICGGEQLLNVLFKGSLYQDILAQVDGAMNHERKKEKEPLHAVKVLPGTLLETIVGRKTLQVNSSHHQAVREIGEGLRVNAVSEDGIIEGIESGRHRFVLGVQWHPEAQSESEPLCRRIFDALIDAATNSSIR
jgi:putative glutamine amidotransferase